MTTLVIGKTARTTAISNLNLRRWLQTRSVEPVLIEKAIRQLDKAAALGEGKNYMMPTVDVKPVVASVNKS